MKLTSLRKLFNELVRPLFSQPELKLETKTEQEIKDDKTLQQDLNRIKTKATEYQAIHEPVVAQTNSEKAAEIARESNILNDAKLGNKSISPEILSTLKKMKAREDLIAQKNATIQREPAKFKIGLPTDTFLNTRVESVSTKVKQSIALNSITYKPTTVSQEIRDTIRKMRERDNEREKEKQQRILAHKNTETPWNKQDKNKDRLDQLASISQRVEEYREKHFGKDNIPGYEVLELSGDEVSASWHDDSASSLSNTAPNKNATTFKLS